MEKMVSRLEYLKNCYKGKRVFLTGHTGFKGAWMMQVLRYLGAHVTGYALPPESENDLYALLNGNTLIDKSIFNNINDYDALKSALVEAQPHFVFHFAAQSLVRRGYAQPLSTFLTNVQGTAHVLDAMRFLEGQCVGVMITTDKVYDNPERGLPFLESDKLGGYDPYSASKAAAEIVIESYRRSYFNPEHYAQHHKSIASARAGNVIGGGDYSQDRIIPDIVRAIADRQPVVLRNPHSVRPWQHVLEPVCGYLLLGAKMNEAPGMYCEAYNFGPNPDEKVTVETLTQIFIQAFGHGTYLNNYDATALHEAKLLLLDSAKANQHLGWSPLLNAEQAIEWSANWYADSNTAPHTKCIRQIEAYLG